MPPNSKNSFNEDFYKFMLQQGMMNTSVPNITRQGTNLTTGVNRQNEMMYNMYKGPLAKMQKKLMWPSIIGTSMMDYQPQMISGIKKLTGLDITKQMSSLPMQQFFAMMYGLPSVAGDVGKTKRLPYERQFYKELGGVGTASRALDSLSMVRHLTRTMPVFAAMMSGIPGLGNVARKVLPRPENFLTYPALGAYGAVKGVGKGIRSTADWMTGGAISSGLNTIKGTQLGGLAAGAAKKVLGGIDSGIMSVLGSPMGLSLALAGAQVGLAIFKGMKLAKIRPTRKTATEIERKYSISQGFNQAINQIQSLMVSGRTSPEQIIAQLSMLQVQLLMAIEQHTSPIAELLAENDMTRQEKEKGGKLLENSYGTKILGNDDRTFPQKLMDKVEGSLAMGMVKYNPFHQITDFLIGVMKGKIVLPKKEQDRIAKTYGFDSFEKMAKEQSVDFGINIAQSRLLSTTSRQLMQLAPSFETQQIALLSGIYDLERMLTSEVLTIRLGMGFNDNIMRVPEKEGLSYALKEALQKLNPVNYPGINALWNLIKLPFKIPGKIKSLSEGIYKGLKKATFGSEYLELTEGGGLGKKLGFQKTPEQKAYEFLGGEHGLPNQIEQLRQINLAQLDVLTNIFAVNNALLGIFGVDYKFQSTQNYTDVKMWNPVAGRYHTKEQEQTWRKQKGEEAFFELESAFRKNRSVRSVLPGSQAAIRRSMFENAATFGNIENILMGEEQTFSPRSIIEHLIAQSQAIPTDIQIAREKVPLGQKTEQRSYEENPFLRFIRDASPFKQSRIEAEAYEREMKTGSFFKLTGPVPLSQIYDQFSMGPLSGVLGTNVGLQNVIPVNIVKIAGEDIDLRGAYPPNSKGKPFLPTYSIFGLDPSQNPLAQTTKPPTSVVARKEGGVVEKGKAYIVNEFKKGAAKRQEKREERERLRDEIKKGGELFIPGSTGRIESNNTLKKELAEVEDKKERQENRKILLGILGATSGLFSFIKKKDEKQKPKGEVKGPSLLDMLLGGVGSVISALFGTLIGGIKEIFSAGSVIGMLKNLLFGPVGALAALFGGVAWAVSDAIKGFKAGGFSEGITNFFVGSMEDSLKATSKTISKWALIGMGVGKFVGPIGMLGGALIGAGFGALLEGIKSTFLAYKEGGIGSAIKQWFLGDEEGGLKSSLQGMGKYATMGVAVGMFGGPPGMIAGALIGAAVGGIIGFLGQNTMANMTEFMANLPVNKEIILGMETAGFGEWGLEFAKYGSFLPIVGPIIGGMTGSLIDAGSWIFGQIGDVYKATEQLSQQANSFLIGLFPGEYANKFATSTSYVIPIVGPIIGGIFGSMIDVLMPWVNLFANIGKLLWDSAKSVLKPLIGETLWNKIASFLSGSKSTAAPAGQAIPTQYSQEDVDIDTLTAIDNTYTKEQAKQHFKNQPAEAKKFKDTKIRLGLGRKSGIENTEAYEPGTNYGTTSGETGTKPVQAPVSGATTPTNISKSPPVPTNQDVKAALEESSQKTGVPLDILSKIAWTESRFNPYADASKNPPGQRSSAKGLFQFITDTWREITTKAGSKYGISPNTSPFDARANSLMGGEFIKGNMNAISSVVPGSEPTVTDVYMAHFLGAGGAKKFFSAMQRDPNQLAASVLPDAASSNVTIFKDTSTGQPRTLSQVYQLMGRKMGQDVSGQLSQIKPTAIPSAPPTAMEASKGGVGSAYSDIQQPSGFASGETKQKEFNPFDFLNDLTSQATKSITSHYFGGTTGEKLPTSAAVKDEFKVDDFREPNKPLPIKQDNTSTAIAAAQPIISMNAMNTMTGQSIDKNMDQLIERLFTSVCVTFKDDFLKYPFENNVNHVVNL